MVDGLFERLEYDIYEKQLRSNDQHGRLGNSKFDAPNFQHIVNCCLPYLRNHSMNYGLEVYNCLWIVGVTFFSAPQR